jgi:hypothetical protein
MQAALWRHNDPNNSLGLNKALAETANIVPTTDKEEAKWWLAQDSGAGIKLDAGVQPWRLLVLLPAGSTSTPLTGASRYRFS